MAWMAILSPLAKMRTTVSSRRAYVEAEPQFAVRPHPAFRKSANSGSPKDPSFELLLVEAPQVDRVAGPSSSLSASVLLDVVIRAARPDDLAYLRDIEREAGAAFRDLDMASVAEDEPPSANVLRGYQEAGRAWVATNDADQPIAYLIADIVDQAAHVEQVSVHPDCARQGLGRQLLDAAGLWARHCGLKAMTLTTFSDVPWNAPYYARLGFQVVAENEWTAGQRSIREHEAAVGLDTWPRVVMRRPLRSDDATASGRKSG